MHTNHILWKVIRDEAILFDTTTGDFFSLSGTGIRIWCLLTEGKSSEEVAHTILAEFEVDPDTVKDDIDELIANMKNNGIIL